MKLYHWTINKKAIEKNGFIDGGSYSDHGIGIRGVWFADQILGPLDGVGKGSQLLIVEIPDDIINKFEWKEQEAGYREWCIPAKIVNKYEIKFPDTYSDRGILKINEATPDPSE